MKHEIYFVQNEKLRYMNELLELLEGARTLENIGERPVVFSKRKDRKKKCRKIMSSSSPIFNSPKMFLMSPVGKMTQVERVTFLKSWIENRRHNPYPTLEEKFELISITGMTLVQLNNWMANARRRYL